MKTWFRSAILACMLPAGVAAQNPAAPPERARVDELFRAWMSEETPGAAVLIMRDGRVVHGIGYGMADLEHATPITGNTVFDIASVSKQFAAMSIALLEAEGRISLDDDVRKYIPEMYDFGHTITIRHLVHHTSGLRDWPGALRIAGWDFQDVMSFDQILRMAYQQRDLNFKPGDEYSYSNTGYNLLAEVVRRVSGKSFREFTDERIFRPLGMKDTHFHDDHTMIVKNRAQSYTRTLDGTYRNVANNLTALGSSSLYTTATDLARWLSNFRTGVVGGSKLIARMEERGILERGDTIAYAFGQMVGTYRGLRTVSHTGSWAGFRTILYRVPQQNLDIVILGNTAEMNTTQLAQRIADIYLADVMTPPVVAATPASAPATPPPTAQTTRWTPTALELNDYAGSFTSAELLTSWTLTVRDGRLIATHFRVGDAPLQPLERDRFQSGRFGEVRFERDAAGRITAFTANAERVRGLRFTKD